MYTAFPCRVTGYLTSAIIWQEAVYTLHTPSQGNTETEDLTVVFWTRDEVNTDRRRRCKLHTERVQDGILNPGMSYCKATVPTDIVQLCNNGHVK